ncbi:hypothetical protein GJ496_007598 [Pomphorhynchus laevis]|nr:hypothetical protein GJ496_007598 [Pomphorhynchus laevis]
MTKQDLSEDWVKVLTSPIREGGLGIIDPLFVKDLEFSSSERMCSSFTSDCQAGNFCPLSLTDEHTHKYVNSEQIVLWFNNVGPNNNQQETYNFYSLPFCSGPDMSILHYHETISERLLGDQLELSGIDIRFKVNVPVTVYCTKTLSDKDITAFVKAISEDYWYQLFIDDLPWRLPVGVMDKDQSFIFQHKNIIISYNNDRIIEINVTATDAKLLDHHTQLSFTYEVHWIQTNISFAQRFDRYKDIDFFQHQIHWFSIFNSFMMVIFMVCFVYLIMSRLLKHDIAAYNNEEFLDIEKDTIDDYGWKQISGDVFRIPAYPMFFSVLIGSGFHVAITAFLCILVTIIGELYTERASFLSAVIFIYSSITPVNGYFGGSKYSQWHGKKWISQFLLSTFFCPFIVFVVTMIISIMAVYNGSTRTITFGSAVSVLTILIFIVIPLNLIGTIIGRATNGEFIPPCRVNPIPRPIPEKRWYMEPWFLSTACGILPSGSAFIEIYFILTSFWAYKMYYVFEFMLLVYIMLIIVTMSVSVICTYFLLNAEDYRWQWASFLCGASISLYMYCFSLYYFLFKTKMFGIFQTTFYFGYMFVFCAILGILCGTASYTAASLFVKRIYLTIKVD